MIEIPPGTYRYDMYPQYVKYPASSEEATWHIWGPADQMREGQVVEVRRYTPPEHEHVEILQHIGHRSVAKRDGSRVWFVLATFDRCAEEASDA